MKKNQPDLAGAISYLLIAGVMVSLLLEISGLIVFYRSYGNLAISQDRTVFIQGRDFFSFIYDQFRGQHADGSAILLMTAGVVVLMLTPYLRVVLSVVYFTWEKDFKYVLITLFVLIVLTLSLVLHSWLLPEFASLRSQ